MKEKKKKENFDFDKSLVSIRRVDERHSPTGKSKGFIIEVDGKLNEKLELYEYYGIRISDCEMWCAEDKPLGQWLNKYLAFLYVDLSADIYHLEVEDKI